MSTWPGDRVEVGGKTYEAATAELWCKGCAAFDRRSPTSTPLCLALPECEDEEQGSIIFKAVDS